MLDDIRIVALGPTWSKVPPKKTNTETWGCNAIYRDLEIDRLFIMHDIRKDLFLRDIHLFENLNTKNIPIYMASPEPGFQNGVVYPIKEVYAEFGIIFFMNVIAYMVAYAIMQKPKKISLYGVDMRPDSGMEHHKNEKGCVEFWLGVAIGRGIKISLPPESYLLKRVIGGMFYGFKPLKKPDGKFTDFIPEKTLACHRKYRVTPVDDKGNDIKELAEIFEIRGMKRTGEVEKVIFQDPKSTLRPFV